MAVPPGAVAEGVEWLKFCGDAGTEDRNIL